MSFGIRIWNLLETVAEDIFLPMCDRLAIGKYIAFPCNFAASARTCSLQFKILRAVVQASPLMQLSSIGVSDGHPHPMANDLENECEMISTVTPT